MAEFNPACHQAYTTGLVDIQVANPWSGPLKQLGHSTDGISVSERTFYDDIHGDRNGGQSGPPVEIQFLGKIASIRLRLSTFNRLCAEQLRTRGGVVANAGRIDQCEIGKFLLHPGRAMRLTLHTKLPEDTMNFYACILRDAVEHNMGTKHTEYHFAFEAHRAPCSFGGYQGILWDRNSDPILEDPTTFVPSDPNTGLPITP